MPLRPSDFSKELQAILGTKAEPHDTTNRQKVCNTDPRITPQVYLEDRILDGHVPPKDATAKPVTETPMRIRNAHRGDILMSPGGPSGMIGALLAALTPPQDYSHCGLILDDGTTVRHCTTLDDHVQLFPRGTVAGVNVPLPVDGFGESVVRYGWPGTLTQRIEDAVVLSRITSRADREASPALNALAIRDPEGPDSPDNKMWISALSFDPSAVPYKDADGTDQWKVVWPVLVKPCLSGIGETAARDVLAALNRVATAAEGLRGHYRTYTYTDAIARSGPPMKVEKPLESEATVPAPGSTCNGAGGRRVAPRATFGYQCASFIWSAVQVANNTRPPGTRRILLDGRPDHLEPTAECVRTSDLIRQRYGDDRFDPATADGLYLYPVTLRKNAAAALRAKIRQKVIDTIDRMLPIWLRAAGAVGVAMTTTQILAAASAGPLLGLANALGVSTLFLNHLIEFITEAPDHIANQVGSTFAFDDSSAASTQRTDWLTAPGAGRTVSPDDIIHNWCAPTQLPSAALEAENQLGLYGRNIRVVVDPPMLRRVPIPPVAWQISQGSGLFRGRVVYRRPDPNGRPVEVPMPRARILLGGTLVIADNEGNFSVEQVPSGRYWLDAEFEDISTGLTYTYRGDVVEVPLNEALIRHIELEAPPASSREVIVVVKADLLHRKFWPWEDPWRQHVESVLPPLRMGLEFYPDDAQWHDKHQAARNQVTGWSRDLDGAATAEFNLQVHLEDDTSLTVTLNARMRDSDSDPRTDTTPWSTVSTVIRANPKTLKETGMDMSQILTLFREDLHIQCDRTGVLPSHASIGIQVWNLRG